MIRKICLGVMVTGLLLPVLGYGAAPEEERGWSFSQRFQGSSNAAGVVMKSNSTVGYDFNQYIQTYAGMPFYFARPKSSSFSSGPGNAFFGFLVNVNNDSLKYSSDLVATAPTGDQDRGFSTGHATVDWTNTFSKTLSSVTPFGSIGAANTVSDTSFFVRPFTSKGAVVHFEGGALFSVAPRFTLGASGYGLQASGEQQVVSKVVKKTGTTVTSNQSKGVFQERYLTVGSSGIANDRGFSTWVSFRADAKSDFQIGYSRSATYQLNSLFFGMGFRVGH